MQSTIRCSIIVLIAITALSSPAWAEGAAPDLRQLPANPIADILSLPLQLNHDTGLGAAGRDTRTTLNLQPIVPMSVSEDWKIISRTIVPLIRQDSPHPSRWETSGLGDTAQSFFLSPKALTKNGWDWGAGVVVRAPTASDPRLGADQWAVGPTAVAVKLTGNGWVVGALANHLWSLSGESHVPAINHSFVQPFFTKGLGGPYSLSGNLESNYDWNRKRWHIPANLLLGKLTRVGNQRLLLQGGLRYQLVAPANAGDWGVRLMVTFLYPQA